MKTMLIRLAAAALLVGLAAGCRHTGNATTPPPGGPGTVGISVTDAPFPADCFSEASVSIDRIELLPVGFTDTPVTATGAMTSQVLTQTAQVFNLIDLAGGVAERASLRTVLTGTYDRIRIVVARGVLTWNDGTGFQREFTLPTGAARIDITPAVPIVVERNSKTEVLLDFDLAATFARSATASAATCSDLKSPGAVTFTPVVRALEPANTGRVFGTVTDVHTGEGFPFATVTATTASPPTGTAVETFSTLTCGNGTGGTAIGAYILYVPPATYDVRFEAPGRVTQTATVTVESPQAETTAPQPTNAVME